jgi:uncharacterized FAD-dependent dehydrogenase
VDARRKADVHFVVSVAVKLKDGGASFIERGLARAYAPYMPPGVVKLPSKPRTRPVVCGAGPAGLFAALTLARSGAQPIVIERGMPVEQRRAEIERFHRTRLLNPDSNIQFGEGGAGAFSDGKLNTGIGDARRLQVLHELHAAGAPDEILWQAEGHIGTDRLPEVVSGLRRAIQSAGGEVRFGARLKDILISDNMLRAVAVETGETIDILETECLILAAGHSARDVYSLLCERKVIMRPKPFSIGVRVEHRQALVSTAQYGKAAGHPALGAANYRLSYHLPSGRSVYTFCMCPGGEVVAAASESGGVVTNGMSRFLRDGENANAALLASLTPADFGSAHPLAGVQFQRRWEEAAFRLGGGDYTAPAQRMGDFLLGRPSNGAGAVRPTYPLGLRFCDLAGCLPAFAITALREAVPVFDRRLRGFADPDALLTGVETRSSAPVRIVRDESGQSSLRGLYPCGEGAGYAGGILSAAVDGLRIAEKVLEKMQIA